MFREIFYFLEKYLMVLDLNNVVTMAGSPKISDMFSPKTRGLSF